MNIKLIEQLQIEFKKLNEALGPDDYAGELFYIRLDGKIFRATEPGMLEVVRWDVGTKSIVYRKDGESREYLIPLTTFQEGLQSEEILHTDEVPEGKKINQAYKTIMKTREPATNDFKRSWNADNTNVPNESKIIKEESPIFTPTRPKLTDDEINSPENLKQEIEKLKKQMFALSAGEEKDNLKKKIGVLNIRLYGSGRNEAPVSNADILKGLAKGAEHTLGRYSYSGPKLPNEEDLITPPSGESPFLYSRKRALRLSKRKQSKELGLPKTR